MLAFPCAGIGYLFAYSYDDLIEFVRFPHLSSVMGCLALGPVCYYFISFIFDFGLLVVRAWALPPACPDTFTFSSSVLQASGFIQIAIFLAYC
jgi:hypothetical protein